MPLDFQLWVLGADSGATENIPFSFLLYYLFFLCNFAYHCVFSELTLSPSIPSPSKNETQLTSDNEVKTFKTITGSTLWL